MSAPRLAAPWRAGRGGRRQTPGSLLFQDRRQICHCQETNGAGTWISAPVSNSAGFPEQEGRKEGTGSGRGHPVDQVLLISQGFLSLPPPKRLEVRTSETITGCA